MLVVVAEWHFWAVLTGLSNSSASLLDTAGSTDPNGVCDIEAMTS